MAEPEREVPDLRGPAVVLRGSPIRGFNVTGPFPTIEAAVEWCREFPASGLAGDVATDSVMLLESPVPELRASGEVNRDMAFHGMLVSDLKRMLASLPDTMAVFRIDDYHRDCWPARVCDMPSVEWVSELEFESFGLDYHHGSRDGLSPHRVVREMAVLSLW